MSGSFEAQFYDSRDGLPETVQHSWNATRVIADCRGLQDVSLLQPEAHVLAFASGPPKTRKLRCRLVQERVG